MGLRFRAVAPTHIFTVLRTPRTTDVTPFDTYEAAEFAILRYVRKNRHKHDIPESWTHKQAWIDWLNRTGETLVIMQTPTWTLVEK
jgi:hypothetical protein